MHQYEQETGKKAIWRGIITEGFKKWQKGERVYPKEKERINVLISEERKNLWQQFANENEYATLSKLIREAMDFFINIQPTLSRIKQFEIYSHDIKEKLNAIKGFSQIIIEDYKDDLNWEALLKIKNIFDQSVSLEKIINIIQNTKKIENLHQDILIIDDDNPTFLILSEFFKKKGYTCIATSFGEESLEILNQLVPKLILIDILLPDIKGYDLCKKIREDKRFKKIPIFYITAVPEAEVFENLKESGANGYFLKPFNMNKFNILFDYL